VTDRALKGQLFDSNVLIAHLRGDERAEALLTGEPGRRGAASVLARTEIEGFMRSGERRDVSLLFSGLDMLPVTDSIAKQAGVWLRTHRRSHPGVDPRRLPGRRHSLVPRPAAGDAERQALPDAQGAASGLVTSAGAASPQPERDPEAHQRHAPIGSWPHPRGAEGTS
jgi:hypothetical protein